jgi:hypothetical protein
MDERREWQDKGLYRDYITTVRDSTAIEGEKRGEREGEYEMLRGEDRFGGVGFRSVGEWRGVSVESRA